MDIPSMDHNIRKGRIYELESWCMAEYNLGACAPCPQNIHCMEFELDVEEYARRFLAKQMWKYERRTKE